MIVFASYRQSLRVRNLLLVITLLALCAVGYKLYATTKHMRYIKAAEAAYMEKDYPTAESYYRLASQPFAARAADEHLEDELASLAAAREEAQVLAEELEEASAAQDPDAFVPAYKRYVETKQKHTDKSPGSVYFQHIIATFELDKKWTAIFTKQKEQAYQQMAQNLSKRNFKNEAFLHALVTIPSAFFGGEEAKNEELAKRFRAYDEEKLASVLEQDGFASFITAVYSSWKKYDEEGIEPVWLQKIAEKQGRRVLQLDRRADNLAAFIKHAKEYERLFSLFSGDSEVKRLIAETIEKELDRARSFMEDDVYSKAIKLYEELAAYTDTGKAIAEAEALWISHDPMRLLTKQYPETKWVHELTGKLQDGKGFFAIGLSAEQQLFYVEQDAKGHVKQFDTAVKVDVEDIRRFTLTDELLEPAVPVLMLEADGQKRKTRYLGYAIRDDGWEQVLSLEADGLQIEEANRLLVDNPVGDGEQKKAYYVWKKGEFVYDGMKEALDVVTAEDSDEGDTSSPTDEGNETDPSDSAPPLGEQEYLLQEETPFYAGPGEQFEMLGKLKAGTVIKAIKEEDGWLKVAFDIGEYWVRRP